MYKKIFLAAALGSFTAASSFSLAGSADDENNTEPFNLDLTLDLCLLTTAAGLNGTVLYFDKVEKVNQIEFDGNILNSSQVNNFDPLLMFPYSPIVGKLGTGLGIVSVLTPIVLLPVSADQWLTIGTMYAETIAFAYGLKELGKLCINRPRPYRYSEGYPADAVNDFDWNRSFPSGHTTLSFAGASFTGFVFSKYYPESKWELPVIAGSYLFAAGTAASRIAAGEHFLTDVIAGAVTGTACGIFVPWIHSLNFNKGKVALKNSAEISVQAILAGAILSVRY